MIGLIIAVNETNAIDFFHALLSLGIIWGDRSIFCARVGDVFENTGLIGQEVCDEMEVRGWPMLDLSYQVFATASHA